LAKTGEHSLVPKVRLLTIWFGANDAALPFSGQHIPINEYEANLTTLVDMVVSPESAWYSPDTRIVLINPPPLANGQWEALLAAKQPPEKMNRDSNVTKEYAEKVVEVAKKKGVAVADVHTAIWDAAGRHEEGLQKYLSDGLHLTDDGYKVVSEILTQVVHERYPELHPDKLQTVFAPWDEINEANFNEVTKKRII